MCCSVCAARAHIKARWVINRHPTLTLTGTEFIWRKPHLYATLCSKTTEELELGEDYDQAWLLGSGVARGAAFPPTTTNEIYFGLRTAP